MTRLPVAPGKALLATGLLLGCCLGAADAHATLGGDVASVAANQQNLGGTRQIQPLAIGERHELALPSGIVVREFVSASGAVYAITWRGPRMPHLRELLGAYFAQLSSGSPQGGHHRMSLTGTDLVVRSSGHGQTFAGRAWVPSLVPPGVAVDALLD